MVHSAVVSVGQGILGIKERNDIKASSINVGWNEIDLSVVDEYLRINNAFSSFVQSTIVDKLRRSLAKNQGRS